MTKTAALRKTAAAARRGAAPPVPVPALAPAAANREARGSRRRRETRTKLLNAALRLMADRGVDGVAVNEITEAADVGFGSFYNHFESKEALHTELIELVFEEFADALDHALAEVADPAEVIATSVRQTINRARADATWARFLMREAFTPRMLTRGLALRLLRDIRKGLDAGRFFGDDELVALLAIAGTTLNAIALDVFHGAHGEFGLDPALKRRLGLPDAGLPERVATAVLRFLGVPPAEARRIARRPLAPLAAGPVALA